MEVEFDEKILTTSDIEKSVKDAGYKAYTSSVKSSKKKDTALVKLIVCFSLLVILMYVTMGHMIGLHLPKFLSGTANALRYAGVQLILIVPILIIYNHFFISGYKKLFKGAPNMDSLIALGATASIIYGIFAMIRMTQGLNSGDLGLVDEYRHNLYFESAGMILTLVSFGKYLESLSKKKTSYALDKLITLTTSLSSFSSVSILDKISLFSSASFIALSFKRLIISSSMVSFNNRFTSFSCSCFISLMWFL